MGADEKRGGLLLKGGRILDPASNTDQEGDLLIEGGTITDVRPGDMALQAPPDATVIDLSGKWVVPGLIDMHVHLREPGEEYKETIASGTRAAAAGGFTAVACMPNTRPVNDNQTVTRFILDRAREAAARVYPIGAITKESKGEELAELGDLATAGVRAVSDDGRPLINSQLMRRALEYASNFGLLVISHCEDPDLSRGGTMNEGYVATRLGLQGIPAAAEEVMVYRDIALAAHTNGRVHIAHVSTEESVDLIRRAKQRGCQVTAETAPHYFSLTEEAIDLYEAAAKMNPPLRTADDVAAICEGLRDGTLDTIASDHAPHHRLEKQIEMDLAANGIIGLETAVPLTLALVHSGIISPLRFVELLSFNPSRILRVDGGRLLPGSVADITIIDPLKQFVFTEQSVRSKSKNSPFINRTFTGKAILTIKGGVISHREE